MAFGLKRPSQSNKHLYTKCQFNKSKVRNLSELKFTIHYTTIKYFTPQILTVP